MTKTKYTTFALPYANGNLHWGHFFEAVIADIFSKHNGSFLLSGDDQHGAAISIYTQKLGLDTETHLSRQKTKHIEQLNKLKINFAKYGHTHNNSVHTQLVQYVYTRLVDKNLITEKPAFSWFDEKTSQYLPDRYVKGNCPHCHAINATYPVCEVCSKYFKTEELINPVSVLNPAHPVCLKQTIHVYLDTSCFFENLKKLLHKTKISESILEKVLDPTLATVVDLDISRDSPYFGIDVPHLVDQKFYVWFEAPLAYLSLIIEHLGEIYSNKPFDHLIGLLLNNIELTQFIGKDITYFHTFLWLNLLDLLDFTLPTNLFVHGWLLAKNGDKLAKSNGNSIVLQKYTDEQIDAIRLYFSSNYDGKSVSDVIFDEKLVPVIDLYNSVIVGKYVNIYSRISKIVQTNKLTPANGASKEKELKQEVIQALSCADTKKAVITICQWIDRVNRCINENKPWETVASDLQRCVNVCEYALNEFFEINQFISLFCPTLGQKITQIDREEIKHIRLASPLS